MSKIKIIENKNDGWSYDVSSSFPKGIYEQELNIFEKALLSLFSDSKKFKRWERGDNSIKKNILMECLDYELNSIRENLLYDLKNYVRIYPLIKKQGDGLND